MNIIKIKKQTNMKLNPMIKATDPESFMALPLFKLAPTRIPPAEAMPVTII